MAALLAWTLSAALLIVATATLRAVLDGEREMRASDAAFDRDDLRASIHHARRAAAAYAPEAPHVARAYARLTAIARGAEARGDVQLAFVAWQAQRAAVLESRHLRQPFPERLEEASRNLARLGGQRAGGDANTVTLARKLLDESRARSAPGPAWGALLVTGLLLGAAGLSWFAARALRPDGSIAWRHGRLGLVLVVAGAACWAIAAYRA